MEAAVDNFARNVRGRNNAPPAAGSVPMFGDIPRKPCFTTGLELASALICELHQRVNQQFKNRWWSF